MLPQIGDKIGGGAFTIRERLGEGAMGAVFAANQEKLDRTVAIKFIQEPHAANDADRQMAVKRLKDEAQAASRISHDHLVEIYDTGEDEKFGPYIVYEYIAGLSLRERLDKLGALDWPRALELVGRPLLGALGALHDKGIIHRDVKPDNILTTDKGVIKLADLGLAQFSDRSAHTRAGIIIGTPGYIAPEGAMGEKREPTAAYDIYSAAIVLIEAATGKTPFRDQKAVDIVREQLTREITADDLVKLGLPNEAANCLARAIAIKSEKRYQTIAEFLRALEETHIRISDDVTTKKVRRASGKNIEKVGGETNSQPVKAHLIWLALLIPLFVLVISLQSWHKPVQKTLQQQKQDLLAEVSTIARELKAYPCCNKDFSLEFEPAVQRLYVLRKKLGNKGTFVQAVKRGTGSHFVHEIIMAAVEEKELNSAKDICRLWTKKADIFWWQHILNGKLRWNAERLEDSLWLVKRATRLLKGNRDHFKLQENILHRAFLFCSNLPMELKTAKEANSFRCWLYLQLAQAIVIIDEDAAAFEDMEEALCLLFFDPELENRKRLCQVMDKVLSHYRNLPRKSTQKAKQEKMEKLATILAGREKITKAQFNERLEATYERQGQQQKEILALLEKETWALKSRVPAFIPPFRSVLWLAAVRAALLPKSVRAQSEYIDIILFSLQKRKDELISSLSAFGQRKWYWSRGLARRFLYKQGAVAMNEIHSTLVAEMKETKEHPWPLETRFFLIGKTFLLNLFNDDGDFSNIWYPIVNEFDDRLPTKYVFLSYGLPSKEQKNELLKEANERLLILAKASKDKAGAEALWKLIKD